MTDDLTSALSPRCLHCGHPFGAIELAALTAVKDHEDQSVIQCASCGAFNVAEARQQGGFEHQPELVVLRIAEREPESGKVFHESVEAGVQVDPHTAGESS